MIRMPDVQSVVVPEATAPDEPKKSHRVRRAVVAALFVAGVGVGASACTNTCATSHSIAGGCWG